jgi:hypothetical protein
MAAEIRERLVDAGGLLGAHPATSVPPTAGDAGFVIVLWSREGSRFDVEPRGALPFVLDMGAGLATSTGLTRVVWMS